MAYPFLSPASATQPEMQTREKPACYGQWWNANDLDEAWYRNIFALRSRAHAFFLDWFSGLIRCGDDVATILEVGCGRAYPYGRIFDGYDYTGNDISEKEIAFCRETYPSHRFFVSDVVAEPPIGPFDLVFSHAVIDHVYDIDRFLVNLAKPTAKHLYVSSYRGWFPRLESHVYDWYEEATCYNNSISSSQARRALQGSGFATIEIFPVYVGNTADDIPLETVIIASR